MTAPPVVNSPSATPPSAATAARDIDSMFLTPPELSRVLGGTKVSDDPAGANESSLKLAASSYGSADHSRQVEPPSCAGVAFTGDVETFGSSAVQKMKTNTYAPENWGAEYSGPNQLQETVAIFPSAAAAQGFLQDQQQRWTACAQPPTAPYPDTPKVDVAVTLGYENSRAFVLGPVQAQGNVIAMSMASNGGLEGPDACQIALGVRDSVVVQARTCQVPLNAATIGLGIDKADPSWAVTDAQRIVAATLDKVS